MTRRRVELEYAATGGQALATRFRALGESGERAMARLRRSVEPVNPALRAVNAGTGELRGQLEGLAVAGGPVGSVLRALGPAGLAAAAGLGAGTMALRSLVQAGEQAERRQLRLQSLLRATGYAAGQTRGELERMAVSLARDTHADVGPARDVIGRLLMQPEIGPEIFERTLRISQDLAEVMGRDLAGGAELVGRALASPTQGMQALRRAGIQLSQEQREQIRLWEESGELLRAQTYLLEQLEQRVGGTGAAAGGGLSGAWGTLTTNMELYIERAAAALGVTERMKGLIDALGQGVGIRADSLVADRTGQQIVAATREVARLEEELARARRGEFDTPAAFFEGREALVAALEEGLAEAREREARLLAEARQRAQEHGEEQQQAEEGRVRALAERRAEQILAIEQQLEQERLALRENALERIRAAEARELERLQNLRAQSDDPEELARIDQAIAARRALTEREIAGLTSASEEAARRRAEAEAARATQQRERNLQVLAGLQREIELLEIADQRERARVAFIEGAMGRLSDAGPGMRQQVGQAAGRLFDAQQAERDAAQVESAIARQRFELEGLERSQGSAVTALERWRTQSLASLDQSADGYEEFASLVEEIFRRRLPEAREEDLRRARDWQSGMERGLAAIAESAGDAASQTEQLFGRAFRGVEDSLTGMIMRGKADWQGFISSLIEDFIRMQVRLAVIQPMAQGLQSMLGTSAMVAHAGGIVGETALPSRLVPAAAFLDAPRYHRGGIVGFAPDERPAVLRVGEEVLTPEDPRHRRNLGAAAQNITINVSAGGGDPAQVRRSIGRAASELARVVARGQRRL